MVAQQSDVSPGTDPLDAIDRAQWARLATATILFDHHSVGRNILAGVSRILAERSEIELSIVATEPGEAPEGPGLFHFSTGQNGDPTAKLEGFADVMSSPLGARADLALCKLCYADIGPGVEAEPVFRVYRETLASLETRHPGTLFIHPTIPLKRPQSAKARLKSLVWQSLGRAARPDPNIARNRYNAMLRAEYEGRAPIFDIAALESTHADGRRAGVGHGSETTYVMAPEWTDDGGHLSEAGQRWVAAAFLALLARHAR